MFEGVQSGSKNEFMLALLLKKLFRTDNWYLDIDQQTDTHLKYIKKKNLKNKSVKCAGIS